MASKLMQQNRKSEKDLFDDHMLIPFFLQDISWFDGKENSTGALTTILAIDTAQLQGVHILLLFLIN